MNQDDIQLIFLQECDEGLASAEIALIDCQSNPEDSEAINSIFREVHSIKGGAGACGFTALQQYTHKFETELAQVRNCDKPLTGERTVERRGGTECVSPCRSRGAPDH